MGYGVTEKGGDDAVTPDTLFQAGSISKPVWPMGSLLLVQESKLTLDEDVNAKLTSWKVPENAFTEGETRHAARIPSHSAGLTVHGFPGYATERSRSHPGAGPRRREAREHASHQSGHSAR